ncbi:hypothetical protein FFF34_015930 [Inquilinus sp. KBS0705]|nr:hypothetical protein FFF34_015930 [Inquilinus sp. KBS0705]
MAVSSLNNTLPTLMHKINRWLFVGLLVTLLPAVSNSLFAQGTLARNISIHVKGQRLGTVLKTMEERGNFYFSYNSNIVKRDSLVTIDADNWTVKEVLDRMLSNRFEYKQANNFIILRYAPLHLDLTTQKSAAEGSEYVINGFVSDEQSGKKLPNASVYERNLLQSALTDENGYFELRVKNEGAQVQLTISKELYKDTTINFLSEVNVTKQGGRSALYYALNDDPEGIETTSIGRMFLSTARQIQAVNLRGLIANAPFQASAIPNVSTHGEMNGQIVNTVSLNAVGGYNAGVDGFELGIIFNLDKGDVRSVQLAGVFNVVGGSVGGFQLGGLYNNVLGNVNGVQLAILHNSVKKNLNGAQLSLYNHVRGKADGIQIAPLGNIVNKNVDGIQIAGLANIDHAKFEGVQIGLFNYTKNLRGMQIGLVNIADTSSGFSLGLINYARNGYFKISLLANETLNANLAIKSGSRNFYTIYTGGARLNPDSKIYGFGMGFGTLTGKGTVAFNPEISSRYLYEGTWRYANFLNRLDANINVRLAKRITLLAGPSVNFYYTEQGTAINSYALAQNLQHNFSASTRQFWWVGWNVGLNFF